MLEFMSDMGRRNGAPKNWFYSGGPADLLLHKGQWFLPTRKKIAGWRGMPNACFRNAALVAMTQGLRYIEGYTAAIIPVHHAWCADDEGNVYEVTWDKPGHAYFGVEFDPKLVFKGSVLWNPVRGVKMYQKELKPFRRDGTRL
jgi:hypothetical protein